MPGYFRFYSFPEEPSNQEIKIKIPVNSLYLTDYIPSEIPE